MTGYAAVAHGRGNVVYMLLVSCLMWDLVMMYVFVYEKAFAIPEGLERLKRLLKLNIGMC